MATAKAVEERLPENPRYVKEMTDEEQLYRDQRDYQNSHDDFYYVVHRNHLFLISLAGFIRRHDRHAMRRTSAGLISFRVRSGRSRHPDGDTP